MANELIKVQFHGDTLDACGTCREDAEVSIRRVCENLGLSMQGQFKKLQGKSWATVNQKLMVADDNKPREVATIALKSLPMWLATIDPRKVKEQFREKLARYQNECADVLARHFLEKPTPGTVSMTVEQFNVLLREATLSITGRVEHLQQQLDRLLATPAPMLAPLTPQFTVRSRLAHRGLQLPKDARRQIYVIARGLVEEQSEEPLCQAGGQGGGGPTWFGVVNVKLLDRAIDTVVLKIEARRRADEQRQPTIPFPTERKAS
jgi:hypothetical protein